MQTLRKAHVHATFGHDQSLCVYGTTFVGALSPLVASPAGSMSISNERGGAGANLCILHENFEFDDFTIPHQLM
jgi:hypothetical protein